MQKREYLLKGVWHKVILNKIKSKLLRPSHRQIVKMFAEQNNPLKM